MGAKFLRSYDDVSAKMTPHPHRFFSFPGDQGCSLPLKRYREEKRFPAQKCVPGRIVIAQGQILLGR